MTIHVYEIVNRITGETASFTYIGNPEPWKPTDDANELLGVGHYAQWLHIVKTLLWNMPLDLAEEVNDTAEGYEEYNEEFAFERGAELVFKYVAADMRALIEAVNWDGCNHDEKAYRIREKYQCLQP